MSVSLPDPTPEAPFAFLRRLGRGRADYHGETSASAPVTLVASASPAPRLQTALARPAPTPPHETTRTAEQAAQACQSRFNWMLADLPYSLTGGLYICRGEIHAWAFDRDEPARPLGIALVVDGMVEFEGWTDPAQGSVAVATQFYPAGHRTLNFIVQGHQVRGPAFTGASFWPTKPARADVTDFLGRLRKSYRARALRRALQRDINGTLARLAQADTQQDDRAPASVPHLVRYLAQRSRVPVASGGPLAVANWVISEILEDPHRREVFCLDPATESILNEPAFNPVALRSDVSLALLCFWRRHYRDLDIFSDDGLRRIQYKFVTAPFIGIKNNHRLIPEVVKERLSALSGSMHGGDLPWSWYWTYLHQDQGNAEALKDPLHAAALSFKEVAADALDPERLSFNPPFWKSYWSAWAAGDGDGFSRFDLALIALLCETEHPELTVAEDGPELWRKRLIDEYYGAMPGLAGLSLACRCDPVPAAPFAHPRRDLAIIGWMNGTGLARNMAMFAEALRPCQPLLFDAHSGRCVNAETEEVVDVRANTVILCVNADAAPEVLGRFASLCADAHVVGFFLWETDQPPALHQYGARTVDEIWCPTSFVAEAYRKVVSVPVHVVGKGLRPPDPRTWMPFVNRLSRRSSAFTFLCLAEFASSIIRKNPLDSVRAFQRAFDRDNHNVRLILKMRNIQPGHWSNIDRYWEDLEELIAADHRIELLTGDLPEEEYWGLIGACDALISLHRGEGFGYPIADAMMLGKPVIVSNFSGNTDYCDEHTAYLVETDIVPCPPEHLRSSGYIGRWCVPRLDSAVAAMRRVVVNRAEAAARAASGQRRIAQDYDFDTWRRDLIARVTATLPSRPGPGATRLALSPHRATTHSGTAGG